MIDRICGNNSKNVGIDPSPEDYVFCELNVLKFSFGVQVENLENVASGFIGGF